MFSVMEASGFSTKVVTCCIRYVPTSSKLVFQTVITPVTESIDAVVPNVSASSSTYKLCLGVQGMLLEKNTPVKFVYTKFSALTNVLTNVDPD